MQAQAYSSGGPPSMRERSDSVAAAPQWSQPQTGDAYGSSEGLVNDPPDPEDRFRSFQGAQAPRGNVVQRFFHPVPPPPNANAFKRVYRSRRARIGCCLLWPPITVAVILLMVFVAAPAIANEALHSAQLNVNQATISNPTNNSFFLNMTGSVSRAGSFSAHIHFPNPVSISWQDPSTPDDPALFLGSFFLQDLSTSSTGHADLFQSSLVNISSGNFSTFTKFLMTNEEFTWLLTTDGIHAKALGTLSLSGLHMKNKPVTLKGIDNFQDVQTSAFDLPSDASNGAGITMEATASLVNPSPFQVDIGTLSLYLSYGSTQLGLVHSTGPVNLTAGNNTIPLTGTLQPQNGSSQGIDDLGTIFSNFLAGKATPVVASKGFATDGSGQNVGWLSEGIAALSLNVSVQNPGGRPLSVVKGFALDDIEVQFTSQSETWAPLASSKTVSAQYQNPFGFSLTPLEAGIASTISFKNQSAATLNLPLAKVVSAGTSTGKVEPMVLSFANQTLQATDHDTFQSFLSSLAQSSGSVGMSVGGTASVKASTSIGDVTISGIPLDVTTSLTGAGGLGGKATIEGTPTILGSGSNSDPFGDASGSDFIRIATTAQLQNPANLSLTTNQVSLPVTFKGTTIGNALIDNFELVPGATTAQVELHYAPQNPSDPDALALLQNFVTTKDPIDVTIAGSSSSSPYASVGALLDGITLDSSFNGAGVTTLLQHLDVYLDVKDSACNAETSTTFNVLNPLGAPIVLTSADFTASLSGTQMAGASHTFSTPLAATPNKTATSESIEVNLTQKLLGSLALLFKDTLDVSTTVAATVGENGYAIPSLAYSQNSVPYTIHLTTSTGQTATNGDVNILELFGELLTSLPCIFDGSSGSISDIIKSLEQLAGGDS